MLTRALALSSLLLGGCVESIPRDFRAPPLTPAEIEAHAVADELQPQPRPADSLALDPVSASVLRSAAETVTSATDPSDAVTRLGDALARSGCNTFGPGRATAGSQIVVVDLERCNEALDRRVSGIVRVGFVHTDSLWRVNAELAHVRAPTLGPHPWSGEVHLETANGKDFTTSIAMAIDDPHPTVTKPNDESLRVLFGAVNVFARTLSLFFHR